MVAFVGGEVDFGDVVSFLSGVFLFLFLAAAFVAVEDDVLAVDGEAVLVQVLRVAVCEEFRVVGGEARSLDRKSVV